MPCSKAKLSTQLMQDVVQAQFPLKQTQAAANTSQHTEGAGFCNHNQVLEVGA